MLTTHLTAHLECTQNVTCRQILQVMAETGQPFALIHLARRVQMSPEHLAAHLAHVADTEFDREGRIIGWGMTLVSTPHQFQVKDHALFTWCAFDTVLFPSLLQTEARVQSVCSASGQPITFVAMPEGVARELTPTSAIMSLILPKERSDCVRATFCAQSLFFESEQAASAFLSTHPGALTLSIEEAALVGRVVASRCFTAEQHGGSMQRVDHLMHQDAYGVEPCAVPGRVYDRIVCADGVYQRCHDPVYRLLSAAGSTTRLRWV